MKEPLWTIFMKQTVVMRKEDYCSIPHETRVYTAGRINKFAISKILVTWICNEKEGEPAHVMQEYFVMGKAGPVPTEKLNRFETTCWCM